MSQSNSALAKLASLCALFCFCFPMSLSRAAGKPTQTTGLDLAAKEFRFNDLNVMLSTIPPGPEHDYFVGLLANAENHVNESIQLLTSALPSLKASRADRAAIALQTLADDYTKVFRYADAAKAAEDLLAHYSGQLTPEQLTGTKNDSEVMKMLRDAPAQTVVVDGPVRLSTKRNAINSLNVDLTINGVTGPWLLDTGANLSVVSKSFAEKLGLKLLSGVAHEQAGLTGIQNPTRIALVSTLQMGGASLHNVVLMVLDDANLNIPLGRGESYQINGIIGYPVLQALGAITFLHDGEFKAGPPIEPSGTGARMYMKGLSPIVMCKIEGRELPFSFDTGASDTNLLVRYYRQFQGESATWKTRKEHEGGAGGVVKRRVYVQPELKLGIGERTVVLHNVSIYTSGTRTDTDELFGNLGQDLPADFSSFTLDFVNMRFSLGDLLPNSKSPH